MMNLNDAAIVPTVMIPLAAVGVALSVLATTIAGFFGIELKAEGPRQLLEVLLKPKILGLALLMNGGIYGGIKAYTYLSNQAQPLFWIAWQNRHPEASSRTYDDVPYRQAVLKGDLAPGPIAIGELWHQKLPKGSFREATLSGSSAFIGADDGYAYELDLKDQGRIVRRFYVGKPVSPAPSIWQGQLFLGEGDHGTHDARIYKFDLASGKLAGTFATKGHTEAQPRVIQRNGEAFLVFPAGADGLYSIDPVTMKERWHDKVGHTDAEVVEEDGLVFVGTGRERDGGDKPYATAYELTTGKRLWQQELPASSFMSPILYRENVCFALGEIYFPSALGGLYCFKRRSGEPAYTYNHGKPITGVPLVHGDAAFLADREGRVCALDLLAEKKLWCQLPGRATFSYSSVAYDETRDILVFAHHSDGLFLIQPKTGVVISHWQAKDPAWQETYASVSLGPKVWVVSDYKGNVRGLAPRSKL